MYSVRCNDVTPITSILYQSWRSSSMTSKYRPLKQAVGHSSVSIVDIFRTIDFLRHKDEVEAIYTFFYITFNFKL